MRFTIYQESRQGGRNNNEDRMAYCYSRDALLMVIADGMGGHLRRDRGADRRADAGRRLPARSASAPGDPFLFLQKRLTNAHHAILDYTDEHRMKDTPRTTCVACMIQDNVAYWAHAGDSRLLPDARRQGHRPDASDHSRVRLLVDQGMITEAQAAAPATATRSTAAWAARTRRKSSSRARRRCWPATSCCSAPTACGVSSPANDGRRAEGANLIQAVPMLLNQAELPAANMRQPVGVAVRWEDSYVEDASSAISTKTMSQHEVTTRSMNSAAIPAYKSDLSDDEIEKAIEEIRSAIDKYSEKIRNSMRPSQRQPDQLRTVRITRNFTRHAEGSVLIEMGDTRVLCTASVEENVPPFLRGKGQGWVTAEYGMLPRSTHTRTAREAAKGKQSGRTQEIQRLIGRALRAVVRPQGARRTPDHARLRRAAGRRRHPLRLDHRRLGRAATKPATSWSRPASCRQPGTRPRRRDFGRHLQGRPVLDLDYPEDSGCDTDMNVVMTGNGGIVEIQGTAEGEPFTREQMSVLVDLADARHPPPRRRPETALAS
jgi:ribonuclease PH